MTTWKLRKYKSSSDLQIHQMVWTLNQVKNTFLYQNEFDSSSVYVLGGKQYRNGKAVEEINVRRLQN